ncbi:uncharacterized protein AB675_10113 [Cyphellophora attinorum]|uniref:Beta-lactamase-related domain-containing protein n=1 Tax=Cyphellophora attinorum TaxID=1664694 RepID=A0A0N1GXN1_9EURO|nr:uncharacterized protein AB675_10113 [Phialophora attinorum]KPI35164.1 hypothetical protein AB675_10113 [Phialophora attinorum]
MSSPLFDQLEELVRQSGNGSQNTAQVLQDLGVPSATIAVLDDGEISSYCISSIGDDPDTLFQACSISKPAAVMAALRLVEEGHFAITDPIRPLLPAEIVDILIDRRTEAALNSVTVARLMSHTAGLSISGFPGYPYGTDVPDVATLLKGTGNTMKISFSSLPGAEFIYSGGGITLLQCIMEKATGLSLPEIMKKYILDPLEMTRSFYQLSPEETNVSRCFYHGYTETEYKWHCQPEQAAAGLWTTPRDLLRLVKAVQDSLAGTGVLQKSTAQTMLTRVTQNIALGWFIGSKGFCHTGGNMPGWKCFVSGFQDLPWNAKDGEIDEPVPKRSGIAIMTNSAVGLPVVFKLFAAICYLKNWPLVVRSSGGGDAIAPLAAPAGTVIREEWKDWIGEWGDNWRIATDQLGGPMAGVDGVMLLLKPAAISPSPCGKGQSTIDLLVDGTELMLRLGWKDDQRSVELWNGALASSSTLECTQQETSTR